MSQCASLTKTFLKQGGKKYTLKGKLVGTEQRRRAKNIILEEPDMGAGAAEEPGLVAEEPGLMVPAS